MGYNSWFDNFLRSTELAQIWYANSTYYDLLADKIQQSLHLPNSKLISNQRQLILTKNRTGPWAITHGSTIFEGQRNWLKFGIQILYNTGLNLPFFSLECNVESLNLKLFDITFHDMLICILQEMVTANVELKSGPLRKSKPHLKMCINVIIVHTIHV